MVASGDRPSPTEPAAETAPFEKLYIILKLEIPLPRRRSALFVKGLCVGGGRGVGTSQVSLSFDLLAKNRLGVCKTPILLSQNRACCGFYKTSRQTPSAASGGTSPTGGGRPPLRGGCRQRRLGEYESSFALLNLLGRVSHLRNSRPFFPIHSSPFPLHCPIPLPTHSPPPPAPRASCGTGCRRPPQCTAGRGSR